MRLMNVLADMGDAMEKFGTAIINGIEYAMTCEPETDAWGTTTAWMIPTSEPIVDDHANLRLMIWKGAST